MGKSTFRTPRRSERRAWRRKRLGLPSYTTAEEIWNAISHGLGAAFAIVALVLLLVNGQHNALTMVNVFALYRIYIVSCVGCGAR